MATREGIVEGLEGVDRFDALSQEIEDTFSHFHSLLETQRMHFLERVRKMRDLYQEHQELSQAIEELEEMKRAANLTMKANLVANRKEKVLKEWGDEIKELKQKKNRLSKVSNLILVKNTEELNDCVKGIHLREIGTLKFSKRKEPRLMKGKRGFSDGEVIDPQSIAMDDREVFIADCYQNSISVYTFEGDFIRNIGKKTLNGPWGICIAGEFLFVSNLKKPIIYKLSKTGELVKKTSLEEKNPIQLNHPAGMCVHNELLYVCNSNYNRIEVLSLDLAFVTNFGKDKLKYPEDIKIFNNEIFVLTHYENTIHTFSTEHNYLRSIHFIGQQNKISKACFFTIDYKGNFIVSDFTAYCLKVFTPTGEYRESLGEGFLLLPRGVTVDSQQHIFVINPSDYKCFQVY